MITFIDGPVKGEHLSLRRTPVLLRVVIDRDGSVDALDQLDDEPRETETIVVYRLIEESLSRAIVCSRGRGCRNEVTAEYRLFEHQPDDEDARDTTRWRAWCEEQRQFLECENKETP